MEEKKFLGMPKKVCLGLGWLTLVIAIVALAVDHEKMEKEDKKQVVSIFVGYGCAIIAWIVLAIVGAIVGAITAESGVNLGWIFTILELLVYAVMIVCMIFAFLNEDFKAPVFYNIAGNFVKDGEGAKEEKAEEPKAEEAPAEEEKKEE